MSLNTIIPKLGTSQPGRIPSPDVWTNCPWEEISSKCGGGDIRANRRGAKFFDHFTNFPLTGTQTTQIGFADYKIFSTASGTVAPVLTVNSVQSPGGILGFQPDADNHGAHLADAYPWLSMTGDATKDGRLWFECSIAVSSIVASHISFMVGLAETNGWTLATGVPYSSDTGAAITNGGSFIGFKRPAASTTTVDTATSDRATSFTAVGTGDVTAVAAYTFFKLGMVYDPRDTVNTVKFYYNSQLLANVVSNATLTATTNLKANNLGLILATQGGSATSSDAVYMDWWAVAQDLPGTG